MRWISVVTLLAIALLSTGAGNPPRRLSDPPRCGSDEQWVMRVGALGMTGAWVNLRIEDGCGDGKRPRITATAKTTQLISAFWRIKDTIETTTTDGGRATVTTRIWEHENGTHRFRTDAYSKGTVTTTWDPGPEGRSVVTTEAPEGTLDPLTVLMLLRGQPLLDGEVYAVPVFSKDSVYLGRVEVVGRDDVDWLGQDVRAIQLHATFEKNGAPSSVFADIWLTDDPRRLPVRVDAGTRYGRLKGTLTEVRNPP